MKFRATVMLLLLAAALSSSSWARSARVILSANEKRWDAPGVLEVPFELTDVPSGQQVRLSADIRNHAASSNGFAHWLGVSVNGTTVVGSNLLNKRLDFYCKNGADVSWISRMRWCILYSPDFSDRPLTAPDPYGFYPEDQPYHFVWDITKYVKPGKNILSFNNPKILSFATTMVLKDLRVEIGEPIKPKSAQPKDAKSDGRLATYIPRVTNQPVRMGVQLAPSGSLRVRVGGRSFDIHSRTSEPDGKWATTGTDFSKTLVKGKTQTATWSGTGCKVERKVTLYNDRIQVTDTFTNTSDKVVGVIYQNRMSVPEDDRTKIRLGGWPRYAPTQENDRPAHPSAIAEMDGLTIGMFAEDDIFRVHIRSFVEPGVIGISDPRLGIGPGKSHTLEWSIYPVPKGDYWDLINAVRRNWGSNFEIPGPYVFDTWSQRVRPADEVDRWIKSRGVKWVCTGQTEYMSEDEIKKYGGQYKINLAEGTAIPLADIWCRNVAEWSKIVHATNPGVKTLAYLHTQICTEPDDVRLYADSQLFGADGKPALSIYKDPMYLFVPTLENSYGKALQKTVKRMISEMKLDGIYNDQFNYGEYGVYGYNMPWDGCTVEIDRNTHAVTRQCSSVTLMQLPWKVWMVKYLQDQRKVIIANDSLHTRTMLKLKVPAFTETQSYANLVDCQLACPLGLGNRGDDCYTAQGHADMMRGILDQGALMATYLWWEDPKSEPFIGYMHPITPMEIRAGMILGKERIITDRSGRYGWPDGSAAETYVFDSHGQLVKTPMAKEIKEGGKRLYELRIPGDHFAVLVRKTGKQR